MRVLRPRQRLRSRNQYESRVGPGRAPDGTGLVGRFLVLGTTKPYEFIGFVAMYVTKPYKFVGFWAMYVTKPYKFIGFVAMYVTKTL